MGFRTRVLVLKRIRAGDQDLLAKVYGRGGLLDLLVRDGFLPENRFFGVFEPFNLVELELRQRGGITVPEDILRTERLSYLCRDYRRYRWMCWVSLFALKHMSFYDERLFSLVLRALLADPKGMEAVLRIRFRLEFLSLSGLEPKFLKEALPKGRVRIKLSDGSTSPEGDVEVSGTSLRELVRIKNLKSLKGFRAKKERLEEIEKLLDLLIEYHTR